MIAGSCLVIRKDLTSLPQLLFTFMKTSLFTVALVLVSHLCSAQRFLEPTNGSWDYPNLSVETFEDFVVSGFTENSTTGLLAPTFKITDQVGNPITSYRIDFPDNAVLMDFTIKEATQTIILTGMLDVPPGSMPYKMFVTEVDLLSGGVLQSELEYTFSGNSTIPHQVIYSSISDQVMIVGTELAGPLDPTNFATVPKFGFVLALDANNFNNILFTHELDMPMGFLTDYDMLENITEVPGSNYFISGSCNGPSGEQNLFTMGVDYGGTITFSYVIDKTNSRHAGSSVIYNPGLNVVYLMANNSIMHQFQVAQCDPTTGGFITPWFRYQITTFPIGSGVDQNGFRLQVTQNKQVLVGGYLSAPFGALPELLTPFQMTLKEDLTFVTAKVYQSGNNSPLSPSYFEENGNSVFINTPDMLAYNKKYKRTYLVSQNTLSGGFDLNISSVLQPSNCEKVVPVSTVNTTHNIIGSGNFNPLPMYANTYLPNTGLRAKTKIVLCKEVAPAMAVNNSIRPGLSLLAPNPATDLLTVTLKDESIQCASVYDMKGNLVLSQKAAENTFNEMTFGVGKLNQGAYLIEITTSEGVIHRERFVKE